MNSQKEQEVQFLLHHMVKVELKYQLQFMKHGNENAWAIFLMKILAQQFTRKAKLFPMKMMVNLKI